jgi:hypothetical protein
VPVTVCWPPQVSAGLSEMAHRSVPDTKDTPAPHGVTTVQLMIVS